MHMLPQPVQRQRRDQCSRQHIRGQHGEHDRFGQRCEQVFGDTAQEEDRHEHDADRECRDQRRHGDLVRAFHDRLVDFLAFLQMRIDVLDGHRGVVDQDADRQRQTAQGHDVDRLTQRGQRDDRSQDRQRDRDGDDQRGTP